MCCCKDFLGDTTGPCHGLHLQSPQISQCESVSSHRGLNEYRLFNLVKQFSFLGEPFCNNVCQKLRGQDRARQMRRLPARAADECLSKKVYHPGTEQCPRWWLCRAASAPHLPRIGRIQGRNLTGVILNPLGMATVDQCLIGVAFTPQNHCSFICPRPRDL